MLTSDLINKLNLIAFEGWEYHKLPLENLEYGGNSQAEGEILHLTLPFQGQSELPWDKGAVDTQSQVSPSLRGVFTNLRSITDNEVEFTCKRGNKK